MVKMRVSLLFTLLVCLGLATNFASCTLRGGTTSSQSAPSLVSASGFSNSFGFNALLEDLLIAPTFGSSEGNAVKLTTGEIYQFSPSIAAAAAPTASGNFWVIFETSDGPISFGLIGPQGNILHSRTLLAKNYAFSITAISDEACLLNLSTEIAMYTIGDDTVKTWEIPSQSVNQIVKVGDSDFVSLSTSTNTYPSTTSFQVTQGSKSQAAYKLPNVHFKHLVPKESSIVAIGYSGSNASAEFNLIVAEIDFDSEKAETTSIYFGTSAPYLLQLQPCGENFYVLSNVGVYVFDSQLTLLNAFLITATWPAGIEAAYLQCHPTNEQVLMGVMLSGPNDITPIILSFDSSSTDTLSASEIGLELSPFKPAVKGNSSSTLEKCSIDVTLGEEVTVGKFQTTESQFTITKMGQVVPLKIETTTSEK